MLIVVGDAPELGESDLFGWRSRDFHDTVFDRQLGSVDLEVECRQLQNFFPQLSRRAVDGADVVQMKIIAAVGGRDTPGGVVCLGSRWIHWAYRITLVLVLVAVAGMWVIRTDESTSGAAVIDGRTGTVAALLPAAAGPDLASSRRLTVTLPGGKSARVTGLHAQLASASSIRRAGLVPLA